MSTNSTNEILRQALYAGADATEKLVPGKGQQLKDFADGLYGNEEKNTPADRAVVPMSWKVPLVDRFWGSVKKTPECWEWTGRAITGGYGSLRSKGKRLLAHRVSWELHNGPIPDGLCVLHKCDNPPCVRPDHLFVGTKRDNNIDMSIKERATIKLSNEQVKEARELFAQGGTGYRQLARHYGVSRTGIKSIITRKTRAYV